MNFHIMTLFPEMITDGLNTSILGRALKDNLISAEAVNIRDFTQNKNGRVDDYTYGGGAGMLMQAQPVFDCYESIQKRIISEGRKPSRVVFVTPRGFTFNQKMAQDFSKEEDLIILCGHYEGIDERVLQKIVTDYVSLGDYVLTGGELPAMVMVDCISRLVPGVLSNSQSSEIESFSEGLLEYPQYTRPEEWHEMKVPDILLSGHHANIEKWRKEKMLEETLKYRPDLYEKYMAEYINDDKKSVNKKKTVAKDETV